MPRYAALFGSLNTGGNRLKMSELVTCCQAIAGFRNVSSVLASGNLLFDHEGDSQADLQKDLTQAVRAEFGFDSHAVVRDRDGLAAGLTGNPFAADGDPKFVHTHFLQEEVDEARLAKLAEANPGRERLARGGAGTKRS